MKRLIKFTFTLANGAQSQSRHPKPTSSRHLELDSGSIPVAGCNNCETSPTGQSRLVILNSFQNLLPPKLDDYYDHNPTGKTNINRSRNKFGMTKQCAFTLAEVLITLVIIGVVAAMTLPTLVHKIEQKILISQFKKMYANLNTALQTTVFQDNDGNPYICYRNIIQGNNDYFRTGECSKFYEDFTKHLKLIKTEEIKYLPYKDEFEVKAEGGNFGNIYMDYIDNDGNNFGTFKNDGDGYYKYYFADGSVFYRSKKYYSVPEALIIIDVNGDKKPNRWGYDVYVLMVDKKTDGAIYISSGTRYMVEKGGMSAEDIIKK